MSDYKVGYKNPLGTHGSRRADPATDRTFEADAAERTDPLRDGPPDG